MEFLAASGHGRGPGGDDHDYSIDRRPRRRRRNLGGGKMHMPRLTPRAHGVKQVTDRSIDDDAGLPPLRAATSVNAMAIIACKRDCNLNFLFFPSF